MVITNLKVEYVPTYSIPFLGEKYHIYVHAIKQLEAISFETPTKQVFAEVQDDVGNGGEVRGIKDGVKQ